MMKGLQLKIQTSKCYDPNTIKLTSKNIRKICFSEFPPN